MSDRERVLTWLEICGEHDDCSGCCPYGDGEETFDCRSKLMADAFGLLKEQENDYKKILSDYRYLTREYIKLLNKRIPLITNGQEVIQCKDCKHWKKSTGHCPYNSIFTVDDWFCADGERRDDNA